MHICLNNAYGILEKKTKQNEFYSRSLWTFEFLKELKFKYIFKVRISICIIKFVRIFEKLKCKNICRV